MNPPRPSPTPRLGRTLWPLLALAVASCGAIHRSATRPTLAPGVSTTLATAGATTAPTPAGTGSSAPQVDLTDSDNHRALTVHRATVVDVTLNSTYWMFAPPTGGPVLTLLGPPVYVVGHCVPGGGCGTVTVRYLAANLGSATLAASRTSCGEARSCRPDQASFDVTVTVTA